MIKLSEIENDFPKSLINTEHCEQDLKTVYDKYKQASCRYLDFLLHCITDEGNAEQQKVVEKKTRKL